jgi:hypothetical protein
MFLAYTSPAHCDWLEVRRFKAVAAAAPQKTVFCSANAFALAVRASLTVTASLRIVFCLKEPCGIQSGNGEGAMLLCIYSEIASNRSLQRPRGKPLRRAENENYLACLNSGASPVEKSMGAESGWTGVEV